MQISSNSPAGKPVAVNRAAVVVTPREPFLVWLNSVDPDYPVTLEELREAPSIYLIGEAIDEAGFERQIRKVCRIIFEEQLESWWANPADWPMDRSWRAFRDWFDVSTHPLVFDTVPCALRRETEDGQC